MTPHADTEPVCPVGETTVNPHLHEVTVLFADLEGSTVIVREHADDVGPARLKTELESIGVGIAKRHECNLHEFRGDEIMACFGVTSGTETKEQRACKAALEILGWVESVAPRYEREYGIRPRLRIGICTDRGNYWRKPDGTLGILGEVVNRGKRIESATTAGQVFICENTQRATAACTRTEAAGQFTLKGFTGAWPLYRLVSIDETATSYEARTLHGLSNLRERNAELDVFGRLLDAVDEGLQILEIEAEPGLGKSRLTYEFKQTLAHSSDITFIRGQCREDARQSPFHPFIDVIYGAESFGLSRDDSDTEVATKLESTISRSLGLEPSEHIPYLMNLLGRGDRDAQLAMDAETLGTRTRQALISILKRAASQHRLVLTIEDWHWIDGASRSLMTMLAERHPDARLLVICTFRPEAQAPAWPASAKVTHLGLAPLSAESIRSLVAERSTGHIDSAVGDLIVAKCEGNPLFAEEMISFVSTTGSAASPHDLRSVVGDPELLGKPQQIFQDRLGRLDDALRRIVDAACVIGQTFTHVELAGIIGEAPVLQAQIEELIRQGIVVAEGDNYRFKHALIRDAAYTSLNRTDKETLHARVAVAIETRAGSRAAEQLDQLSMHYANAYLLASGRSAGTGAPNRANAYAQPAFRYLKALAEKSLSLYSLEDALDQIEFAQRIADEIPDVDDGDARVGLILDRARILFFLGHVRDAVALLEQHVATARRYPEIRAAYLAELGYGYVYRLRGKDALEVLTEALEYASPEHAAEAGRGHYDAAVGRAKMGLVWHEIFCVAPGIEQRRNIQRLAQEADDTGKWHNDPWLRITAKFALSQHAIQHGDVARVEQSARDLDALQTEYNDNRAASLAAVVRAGMAAYNLNYDEALFQIAKARPLLVTPIDRLHLRVTEGVSAILAEKGEEAHRILELAARDIDERGIRIAQLLAFLPYGMSQVATGRVAAGVAFMKRTVRRFDRWGFPFAHVHGHFYLGQVYMRIALRQGSLSIGAFLRNLHFVAVAIPLARRRALAHLGAAARLHEETLSPAYAAWATLDLARLALAADQDAEAHRCIAKADALLHESARGIGLDDTEVAGIPASGIAADMYMLRGQLLARQIREHESPIDDPALYAARDSYETARAIATEVGAMSHVANCLYALAGLARTEQQPSRARSLYVEARSIALKLESTAAAPLLRNIDDALAQLPV